MMTPIAPPMTAPTSAPITMVRAGSLAARAGRGAAARRNVTIRHATTTLFAMAPSLQKDELARQTYPRTVSTWVATTPRHERLRSRPMARHDLVEEWPARVRGNEGVDALRRGARRSTSRTRTRDGGRATRASAEQVEGERTPSRPARALPGDGPRPSARAARGSEARGRLPAQGPQVEGGRKTCGDAAPGAVPRRFVAPHVPRPKAPTTKRWARAKSVSNVAKRGVNSLMIPLGCDICRGYF